MAKFQCTGTPDLVVGTGLKAIQFKNYLYTTTDKDKIAMLKKAKDVKEVGGSKPTPKPKEDLLK